MFRESEKGSFQLKIRTSRVYGLKASLIVEIIGILITYYQGVPRCIQASQP